MTGRLVKFSNGWHVEVREDGAPPKRFRIWQAPWARLSERMVVSRVEGTDRWVGKDLAVRTMSEPSSPPPEDEAC